MSNETLLQQLENHLLKMQARGTRSFWISEENRRQMGLAKAQQPAIPAPAASQIIPTSQEIQTPEAAQIPQIPQAPQPVRQSILPPLNVKRYSAPAYYGTIPARVLFIGDYPHTPAPLAKTPEGEMLLKMGKAMGLYWENPPSPDLGVCTADMVPESTGMLPSPQQFSDALPAMQQLIEKVNPSILILMGALPTKWLTGLQQPFSHLVNSWQKCGERDAVILQNPAMILRFKNQPVAFNQEKRAAWNTLKQVMERLQLPKQTP